MTSHAFKDILDNYHKNFLINQVISDSLVFVSEHGQIKEAHWVLQNIIPGVIIKTKLNGFVVRQLACIKAFLLKPHINCHYCDHKWLITV